MEKKYEETYDKLKENITDLILLYERVSDDNKNLNEQLKLVQKELEEKQKKINELEEKFQSLVMAKSLSSVDEEDSDLTKKRIDRMVREIDKCIALLNS
ncbi:MAG: hypothetical protein Kow0068_10680 [Marinilabiliales bacterium]